MSDYTTLQNRYENLLRKVQVLEKKVAELEGELDGKVSKGTLTTTKSSLLVKIDDLARAVDAVEDKAQNILSPPESLAVIGRDELNTLKTRLIQMQQVKEEIDTLYKSVFDMLKSFKAGQEGIVL